MLKKFVIFIIVATIILGSLIFIKQKKAHKNQKIYTVEKPIRRDLVQFITASGKLQPRELTSFTIGSLVAGKVEKIFVQHNDVVKKGQVLAIIDNGIGETAVHLAQAQLIEAQATLEYQKQFYARQTELYKANQLAKNQYELYTQDYLVAQSRVSQAKANLELQQKTYDNLFIKAPDDGVIISKEVELGQAITAQLQATILFHMAKDLKDLEAYVDIDEADVGMVKDGQEALFSVDAYPQRRYKTTVRLTEYLSKITDNIVTYATILPVKNDDLALRPGMTVNVEIKVRESNQALTVPNKALRINNLKLEEYAQKAKKHLQKLPEKLFKKIDQPRQECLWIVENSAIKQIAVTFGTNDGKYTEVISGITQNTQVITELFDSTDNVEFLSRFVSSGNIGK